MASILATLIEAHGVTSARPSTVDPCFLVPCLERGGPCATVALQYTHEVSPMAAPVSLVGATAEDLRSLMVFMLAATDGTPHHPGFVHLGIVVGEAFRGQGIAARVMSALVAESQRRQVQPLCSTSPDNLAAQGAILRAGFRPLHRVLRISLAMDEPRP